jgi:hypothetical protein
MTIKLPAVALRPLFPTAVYSDLLRKRSRLGNECLRASRTNYLLAMVTASLLRPFALRRFMTSLPFFVDILTRKPCVLLRDVLLG